MSFILVPKEAEDLQVNGWNWRPTLQLLLAAGVTEEDREVELQRRKEKHMKKIKSESDELRSEYELQALRVRRLCPGRKKFGDVVRLEPDVADAFPDANAVNEALRFLIRVTKENRNSLRSTKGDA